MSLVKEEEEQQQQDEEEEEEEIDFLLVSVLTADDVARTMLLADISEVHCDRRCQSYGQ